MSFESANLAQLPHFLPAGLRAGRDLQHISPQDLASLLERFRDHAMGDGAHALTWQARVVQAWHAVARAWENWQFPEAEEVLRRLQVNTRMSTPVLRESIANHFRVITAQNMDDWLDEIRAAREGDAGGWKYPALAFAIASGNVPGAALQPIVQLSLLGIPALVKSASAEPDFMPAVFAALEQYDADVAARLLAFSWSRENYAATAAVLALSPRVIALGDDGTMARLQDQSGNALVPFGDRIGAAIIRAASVKIQTLRQLAYDFIMFDGKGCLSPQALFVIADTWEEVENLALHLAGVLAEENKKWPAGDWSTAEKTLIQQWRGAWQMRRAAGEKIALHQPSDTAWTVVAAEEFDLAERTAFRVVRLWWVKDFAEVMLVLRNYSTKIHALAVNLGDDEYAKLVLDLDEHEELLGRLVCEPGALQRPPFAWMAINRQWFELTQGLKARASD